VGGLHVAVELEELDDLIVPVLLRRGLGGAPRVRAVRAVLALGEDAQVGVGHCHQQPHDLQAAARSGHPACRIPIGD
jgi:hypothetical protein